MRRDEASTHYVAGFQPEQKLKSVINILTVDAWTYSSIFCSCFVTGSYIYITFYSFNSKNDQNVHHFNLFCKSQFYTFYTIFHKLQIQYALDRHECLVEMPHNKIVILLYGVEHLYCSREKSSAR